VSQGCAGGHTDESRFACSYVAICATRGETKLAVPGRLIAFIAKEPAEVGRWRRMDKAP
jgi:hypothetical protein